MQVFLNHFLNSDIENLITRRKRSLLRYMFHQSKDEINKVHIKGDRILRSNKNLQLKSKFSNLSKLHSSPFYRGVKIRTVLVTELEMNKKTNKKNIR